MAKKNRFFPEGTRTDSIPCHDLLVILSCSNYKITETHALQTLAISHLPTVSSSTFLICVLTSETYLRMYFRRAPQGEHGEAGRCDTGDIRNGSVEGGETATAAVLRFANAAANQSTSAAPPPMPSHGLFSQTMFVVGVEEQASVKVRHHLFV